MTNDQNRTRIRGNSRRLVTSTAMYALFYCFIISFVIMGTEFGQLFIALLVLSLPFVAAAAGIIYGLNGFQLDDENKRIVKACRLSVPYDKVRKITIKERWGRSSIAVKTGWLRWRWLADGLNKDEARRAEQELTLRFPHIAVRRKTYSTGKLVAVIAVYLSLMAAAYSGFLYYAHGREPRLFLEPEKKDWMADQKTRTGAHYVMNGIGFRLPRQFKLMQNTGTWLYFEDKSSRTALSAGRGIFHEIFTTGKREVRYLTGVQDSYDLFHLAYIAKYGTLPTAMKVISFRGMRDIKLYEIGNASCRGFVLQGRQREKAFAELVVADKGRGREIHILIQKRGVLQEDLLKAIVGSIKPEEQEKGAGKK